MLQPTVQPELQAHPRRQRRSSAGGNAAEAADAALGRFTDFLARHENELQPRTRQVCPNTYTLFSSLLEDVPCHSMRTTGCLSSVK